MAEADLVREARQGGEEAFLAIYNRHRSPVFQFAWRLTGSRAAAEDVTQECFLALVRGATFDGDRGGLRTYLFGIARNLVLRRLRISEREGEEAADAQRRSSTITRTLSRFICAIWCRSAVPIKARPTN